MTNQDILHVALEQHAIEANCSPSDFLRKDNVVVVSKSDPRARRYLYLPFFCNLISYGSNIVASVDERIYGFVQKYVDTTSLHRCFETPQIHHLTKKCAKYGYLPGYQSEYWLPDLERLKILSCGYETRVLEQSDLKEFYTPQWGNALSMTRPDLDMLGVGAYDGNRLIALAGCSADCEKMWQIGIDVLPEYRGQGIASTLTSRLTVEILQRERVPFYCCSWSNLASVRNAIKSGFRPSWVEHTVIEKSKAWEWCTNKHFPISQLGTEDFWNTLDVLLAVSQLVVDRPKGSKHPRFDFFYPMDYGYLEDTTSMDGGGIDFWRGSLTASQCDAIVCTVDLLKKDSEIKLLIGCTENEKKIIMDFHNDSKNMKGILIRRGIE